jgi:Tol biopolymer transport system component
MRRNKKTSGHLLALCCLSLAMGCNPVQKAFDQVDEPLEIYPDYTSVVIPPNIAPMNFRIENQGVVFVAEISNDRERHIRVKSATGQIEIPRNAWKKLLEEGKGGRLTISVLKKNAAGQWEKLAPVSNEISADPIDPYIAFRKIPPANMYWKSMGIYQRCLEDFKETPIMVNSLTDENCMNCHSFNGGDPDQMVFHMRGSYGGTLVKDGEEIRFVDTKSDHTRSAGVYPAWHPGGELIAFSANMIRQGFHSKMGKIDYVHDRYSDILLYDLKDNSIIRPAELATEKLENLPAWSRDGRTLYYICADQGRDTMPYYTKLYNLMCIGFDPETRTFGHRDTLISYRDFGKSITFPRECPTNELVSFIGVDYGYFSIYNNEADVYFYHTDNGGITRPGINSEFTESYPSWSANGSWLMFVSKRDDAIHSQVWFSHVDKNGVAGRPFVLPQKHPDFYDEYVYNYNRPEFISGKVDLNPRKVFALVKEGIDTTGFNMAASISAASGATAPVENKEDIFYHHD